MANALDWKRVKGGELPEPHQKVLLHTPQWNMTLGEIVTGYWDGFEWEADDGRDFNDDKPIHWAAITCPEFDGDADEWSDVDIDLVGGGDF